MHVGDSVQVTIYARDPNQGIRSVAAATQLALTAPTNVYFMSGGVSSSIITTATIPADAQSVSVYLKAYAQGTVTPTISATNYTTYTLPSVTVIP